MVFILQRFKHFTTQLILKVNFTFNAIGELQPDTVATLIFRFLKFRQHDITPMVEFSSGPFFSRRVSSLRSIRPCDIRAIPRPDPKRGEECAMTQATRNPQP